MKKKQADERKRGAITPSWDSYTKRVIYAVTFVLKKNATLHHVRQMIDSHYVHDLDHSGQIEGMPDLCDLWLMFPGGSRKEIRAIWRIFSE